MKVYRICRSKYKKDLSGSGAELFGGRWNSKGIRAIYTSESRALAMLEYIIHTPVHEFPTDVVLLAIELPKNAIIRSVQLSALPKDWKSLAAPFSSQAFGDTLLHLHSHLCYKLPSVVVPQEFNYLIDPAHAQIADVSIVEVSPLEFDKRLAR